MPEPRTTPNEHDIPVFQPGQPTPDDPRKEAPMKDPPVNPSHDGPDAPVRQASDDDGVQPPNPSPDRVIFDENRVPG